jgi:phytoene dehydrogenase-like protein
VSNANLKATILSLLQPHDLNETFLKETEGVRLNNSSCQVYMGFKEDEALSEIGDLIFTSDEERFSSESLKEFNTRSRTFSVYYPSIRPDSAPPRYTIVASTNALWSDWENLSEGEYVTAKEELKQRTLQSLERFVSNARNKIAWIEVATPRTFRRYTQHWEGSSFGTKFEGLKVSMELPHYVHGLYHSGSVGIIMSGWLGTINYGVITADKVDQYLRCNK